MIPANRPSMKTELIGHKGDILWWEMSIRAVLIFIFGLVLIRLFGRRAFGKQNPLDIVVAIILLQPSSDRFLAPQSTVLPAIAGGICRREIPPMIRPALRREAPVNHALSRSR